MRKSMYKTIFFISTLFIFATYTYSIQNNEIIRFEKRTILSQKITLLEKIYALSMTEDRLFILLDGGARAVKLFNEQGEYLKSFGRAGTGPGEFSSPYILDYRNSELMVYDWGAFIINIFSRTESQNFIYNRAIKGRVAFNCRLLSNEEIIISGFVKNPNNESYELYKYNIKDGSIEYLLPAYMKYGLESIIGYREKMPKYAYYGGQTFLHLSRNDEIYAAWVGKLEIQRVNLKTKEIFKFGTATANYKPPAFDKFKMGQEYIKEYRNEEKKYSVINGLFGSIDLIGLIYMNYDTSAEGWRPVVQIYNHTGKLLGEAKVNNVLNLYRDFFPFYYEPKSEKLYMISTRLESNDTISFEIVTYRVIR